MDLRQKLLDATHWEERYRYIIQAGKSINRPNEQTLSEMQFISGCEAKVWFQFLPKIDRTFHFNAYSESRIINGLLVILLLEIEGKSAVQLAQFSVADYFGKLGIAQRLSESRLNGLRQIEQIVRGLNKDTLN